MTEFGSNEWYDERWQDMPPVMRKLAADTIRKAISDEDAELIRRKHAEFGHDWIHHLIDVSEEDQSYWNEQLDLRDSVERWPTTMSAHHGFGTSIRNLLRDEEYGAGIRDEELPPAPYEGGQSYQNWDDYYVSVIEAAVGLREV